MNQVMEIDIKNGFRPGKDIHLIWSLQYRLESLEKDIKHHRRKREEYTSKELHVLAHDREVTIDKIYDVYCEVQRWLRLLQGTDWYCCRCGGLEPGEVTNDEKCSNCGERIL